MRRRRKGNLVRAIGAVFLLLSLLVGWVGYRPGKFLEGFAANISTSLAGIAITVLIIDYLNERWREEIESQRLKSQLIREMGSPDSGIALRAVQELSASGFLTDGSLVEANLGNANLARADLKGANLQRANLSGAKLQWAKLSSANLQYADLQWADLTSADLNWADLRGAELRGANLREAKMDIVKLSEADLRSADLSKTVLTSVDLSGANLREANLSGTLFFETNLKQACLFDANLDTATLNKCDLTGAQIENRQLKQVRSLAYTILPDGTKHGEKMLLTVPKYKDTRQKTNHQSRVL